MSKSPPRVPLIHKLQAFKKGPFVRCPVCRLPLERHKSGGLYCGSDLCSRPKIMKWVHAYGGSRSVTTPASDRIIQEEEASLKTDGWCAHNLQISTSKSGSVCVTCGTVQCFTV